MSKLDAKLLKSLDELEIKMNTLLESPESLDKLWNTLDNNGNGIVSLAEIDKFAIYTFPLLNNKPALMRAYKKTTSKDSNLSNGDDFVQKNEFPDLIKNLFCFNRIYHVFSKIDSDNDRRLDLDEFKHSFNLLNLNKNLKPEAVFKEIDTNSGGIILFDEFCEWYTKH